MVLIVQAMVLQNLKNQKQKPLSAFARWYHENQAIQEKERIGEEELYSFICNVPLYIVLVLPQLQFDCN